MAAFRFELQSVGRKTEVTERIDEPPKAATGFSPRLQPGVPKIPPLRSQAGEAGDTERGQAGPGRMDSQSRGCDRPASLRHLILAHPLLAISVAPEKEQSKEMIGSGSTNVYIEPHSTGSSLPHLQW